MTKVKEGAKAPKAELAGIALNLEQIVAGPSQTRSPFVDELKMTPFFFRVQFETKVKEDGTKKNTFGVVQFPEPVEATIKGTHQVVPAIMIDLSELLYVAETGKHDLLVNGKANPSLMLSVKNGMPVLH